jgi:hypothetical protein
MVRQSILSVPQPVTPRSAAAKAAGRSSGSKPRRLQHQVGLDVVVAVRDLPCGVWRPDASGMPRWMRTERTLAHPVVAEEGLRGGQPDELHALPPRVLHTRAASSGMLARSRR